MTVLMEIPKRLDVEAASGISFMEISVTTETTFLVEQHWAAVVLTEP